MIATVAMAGDKPLDPPQARSGIGPRGPLDISRAGSRVDSENVDFVGAWPFSSSYAVAIDEDRGLTFLGSGSGVYILDTSDPANPVVLSESLLVSSTVWGLDRSGDLLYVGSWDDGLSIWDKK
jgi:hypothetical protein